MRYIILGAGPAGLTLGNVFKKAGIKDFIIIEKEDTVGGLCRSDVCDGAPIDIGGGHFLDTRRSDVNEFLFSFMPEDEWDIYERKTSLVIGEHIIGQPIEAYIWQLPIDDQIEYLKSISLAGCNIGIPMPEKFTDWIYWKLGRRIAKDYMIPYNMKMFGKDLDVLGTYWLDKLPNVSFEETLRSCLERKKCGKDPGHTRFYYPKKYGYGELWRRMGERIADNLILGEAVNGLDYEKHIISTDKGNDYQADIIITTIPWIEIKDGKGMPSGLRNSLGKLKYSSIQIEYHPEHLRTESQWIYYPDDSLPYHRILVRHNFCVGSKGYWTETNTERLSKPFKKPIQQDIQEKNLEIKYVNKYAYPLNTLEKPKIMKKLLAWSSEHGILGLGRWGEHQHYNSDVTVKLAIDLGEKLIGKQK